MIWIRNQTRRLYEHKNTTWGELSQFLSRILLQNCECRRKRGARAIAAIHSAFEGGNLLGGHKLSSCRISVNILWSLAIFIYSDRTITRFCAWCRVPRVLSLSASYPREECSRRLWTAVFVGNRMVCFQN